MNDETLFHEAQGMSAADRAVFLDRTCGDDNALRRRIESLLQAHDNRGTFMAEPLLKAPASLELETRERDDGTRDRSAGEEPVDRMIGRYKLLQLIGEGGFGTVYMAQQQEPVRRRVAVKIIKLGMDTKAVIARFEAERQALAMMDHPNIAKVLDAGATDTGRPYFVMELVNGIPVTSYCDANRLTARERLELFVPICQAVQHAHQKGIIHRDLKPTNVLVTLNDGRPMPKVIDFGIAKATQARLTEKTLFTEFRQMIGTPQYMSPEQAEMSAMGIDTRSDLYSLGVLLYELLTGTTPLDAGELRSKAYGEMQRMIREEDPPNPSTRLSTMGQLLPTVTAQRRTDVRQLSRFIRGDLDWIVMKCLEKDRSRRYESASGIAADIMHYLADEPVSAAKPSTIYRARKFVHRYRIQVAAAMIVLASLVAGIAASTNGLVRAVRAERIVRRQKDDVTGQRDRAMRAEADAQSQRQQAEFEGRRAQVQYADGLVVAGDAFTIGKDFLSASDRYAQALTEFTRLGLPLARLDLSLVRLYRESPPPLWTADLPGGMPKAWVVLPGRREIVAACADGQYHALDIVTGAATRTISGNTEDVNNLTAVKLSEGVRLIASGAKFVRVIDPATGAIEREVNDDRAASFIATSPDGKLAVSGDGQERGKVTFWETATFKRLQTSESERPTYGVFSHGGGLVAVDDTYGIDLWDVKTQKKLRYFRKMHDGQISVNFGSQASITFTPDDSAVMFTTLAPSGVELRSVSVTSLSASTWEADSGIIEALAVPTEANRVLTASADGRVRVFDAGITGMHTAVLTLVGDRNPLKGLAYIGDAGPRPCAATSDFVGGDQAAAVALNDKGRFFAWPLPRRQVTRGVAYPDAISANGLLYAGNVKGTGGMYSALRLGVCDVATGRSLRLLPPDANPYDGERAEALSPRGETVYTEPSNGSIQAIDVATGVRKWSVYPRKDHRASLTPALSHDGRLLAVNGDLGTLLILDARTGGLLRTLHGDNQEMAALAFIPEPPGSPPLDDQIPTLKGRRLISLSQPAMTSNCAICEWDLGIEAKPRQAILSNITGLTFSPDGKRIVAKSSDVAGSRFLETATFRPAGDIGPFRSPLERFCFVDLGDHSGAWAIGGGDKELIAIDTSTGKEELLLESGSDEPRASLDGTQVLAGYATRINLALPRLYRELSSHPSPTSRAAWYAEYGLWAWARELLERERAASRDIPVLLWARSLWMCGDYAAARPAFKLAVARGEIAEWYADLCLSVGDTPRDIAPIPAIQRLEERYKNRKQIVGVMDPETINVRDQLSSAYLSEQRQDLAQPLLQEMLAVGQSSIAEARRTSPHSLQLADAVGQMGRYLIDLNAAELSILHFDRAEASRQAEVLCREALGIREAIDPENPLTSNARASLGIALLGQKKYADAENMLLRGYEGMKASQATLPPGGKARLLQSAERLVDLYEAQGKTTLAEEWKRKAESLRSQGVSSAQ